MNRCSDQKDSHFRCSFRLLSVTMYFSCRTLLLVAILIKELVRALAYFYFSDSEQRFFTPARQSRLFLSACKNVYYTSESDLCSFEAT